MAVHVHLAEVGLRIGLALRRSEPIPAARLGEVDRPSAPDEVHRAQRDLRAGVTLECCEAVHLPRLGEVLLPT